MRFYSCLHFSSSFGLAECAKRLNPPPPFRGYRRAKLNSRSWQAPKPQRAPHTPQGLSGGRPSGLKFPIFFDFGTLVSQFCRIFLPSFSYRFSASNFDRFRARFGLVFWPFFDHIGSIWQSLFRALISHSFFLIFNRSLNARNVKKCVFPS